MTDQLLDGRVALITGAASGIGRAIAERFADVGARVAVADIDAAAADATAHAVGGVSLAVDVADEASVDAAVAACVAQLGRLDIAVANAGVLHLSRVVETDLGAWRRVLDVNLTGAFLTARAAARRLVAQGEGGRIILTSSLFGTRGGVENAAYSASKFGVVGLAECLAAELAPDGITVNAVCPGQVDTSMMQAFFHDRGALRRVDPDVVRDETVARIPAGRMASAAEVADVFVFLASPMAGYVTGQSLVVDGGMTVA
jgi:NAD(P)-dependent dehydrogenase (short-subunit alcohol dehydrogenase family)